MATLSNFLLSGGQNNLDAGVDEALRLWRERGHRLPLNMDEAAVRDYIMRLRERHGPRPSITGPARGDTGILNDMGLIGGNRQPPNPSPPPVTLPPDDFQWELANTGRNPATMPRSRTVQTIEPPPVTPPATEPPPPTPPPMSNTPPPEPNTWTSSINPPRLPPEREEQIIADANNQVATRDDLRRQSAHLANLFGNAMPDQDPRPNAMSMGLLQGLGPPQVAPASAWLSNPLDQRRPRSMARYGSNSLFGRMA